MQVAQRRAALGHEQAAARLPIQPVHEIQFLAVRPGGPQGLDHAVRHAAAAVHRDARRLVQDQQVLVLVDDGGGEQVLQRLAGRAVTPAAAARLRTTHRGQPDPVAGCDTLVGLGALAVHPHLALAQQAVDVGPRHALQDPDQEIVEPLPGIALAGVDVLHARAARGAAGSSATPFGFS